MVEIAAVVTADTITDGQILAVREAAWSRRQNAGTRATIHDCDGALSAGANRQCCREEIARIWNLSGGRCEHGRFFGHCGRCSGSEHP